MALYNLRSADGDWRITKFDGDLNVESSYLVSTDACECPAGHRPSCRHRQMLPRMLAAQAEDSPMFYDFDHDTWLAPEGTTPEILDAEPMADGQTFDATGDAIDPETLPDGLEKDYQMEMSSVSAALPEGASPPTESRTHPQGSIRRRL